MNSFSYIIILFFYIQNNKVNIKQIVSDKEEHFLHQENQIIDIYSNTL